MSVKTKYVYLSGPITGLDYEGCTDWREHVNRVFPEWLQGVSPMRAKKFLEGQGILTGKSDGYDHPLAKGKAIFSRDKTDTLRSDGVLCNLLGAKQVSIGTVMELAWAEQAGIPVIVAVEPEGNIHDHMMLNQTFSAIYHSLEEAIEGTVQFLAPHEKYMLTNSYQARILEAKYGSILRASGSKEQI